MAHSQRPIRSAIAALITVVLWASAFPAVKFLLDYYSAESILVFRFGIAGLVLLVVMLITKTKMPDKEDLPLLALAGFLGIFLYAWLFIVGINSVSSGVSSFLIASAPVFVTLMSILLLKEKVRLLTWIGLVISFCGLALVTLTQMTGFALNTGVILLLGASLSTSIYTIIQRKLTAKYSPFEVTGYALVFGSLFTLVFLPGLIREIPSVPPAINLIPLYLGIFPAAIAYLSWSYALARARSAAQVTSFLYLIPFLATIMAYLWIGEVITMAAFIGGVVIIAGMIITASVKKTN
ncbi:MAG: DMT family transporter [Coriobacteriia bacterium]|nr:DMT family transporter [Coriobacteriia bacterium]